MLICLAHRIFWHCHRHQSKMATTIMNSIILLEMVWLEPAITCMWPRILVNSQLHRFKPFGIPKSKTHWNHIWTKIVSNDELILCKKFNSFVSSGKSYIKGPWLLLPPEVPGTANRYFYRQELMLSTTHDISPTIAVVGRCAVLEYSEYISCE